MNRNSSLDDAPPVRRSPSRREIRKDIRQRRPRGSEAHGRSAMQPAKRFPTQGRPPERRRNRRMKFRRLPIIARLPQSRASSAPSAKRHPLRRLYQMPSLAREAGRLERSSRGRDIGWPIHRGTVTARGRVAVLSRGRSTLNSTRHWKSSRSGPKFPLHSGEAFEDRRDLILSAWPMEETIFVPRSKDPGPNVAVSRFQRFGEDS